jgi:GMP synthase PP-ATPase subunit
MKEVYIVRIHYGYDGLIILGAWGHQPNNNEINEKLKDYFYEEYKNVLDEERKQELIKKQFVSILKSNEMKILKFFFHDK